MYGVCIYACLNLPRMPEPQSQKAFDSYIDNVLNPLVLVLLEPIGLLS